MTRVVTTLLHGRIPSSGTPGLPLWELVSDTSDPSGLDANGRALVGAVVAEWGTDVLPPVMANPVTISVQIYDDGSSGEWIEVTEGSMVFLKVDAWDESGSTSARLISFMGRVADGTGVNHPDGGVLFNLVLTGVCAEWAGVEAPLVPANVPPGGLEDYITQAMKFLTRNDPGNPLLGLPWPSFSPQGLDADGWIFGNQIEAGGRDVLQALNQLASQAITTEYIGGSWPQYLGKPMVLTEQIDPDIVVAHYFPLAPQFVPYHDSAADLTATLVLSWDGSEWAPIANPDYYPDGGVGLVLDASQVARNSEWSTTRNGGIDSVQLTGVFASPAAEIVTVSWPIDPEQKGPQTRSESSPIYYTSDALTVAANMLGPEPFHARGYALSSVTVAWEALTPEQIDAWGRQLWPNAYPDNYVPGPPFEDCTAAPAGRAMVITSIPDDWRLSTDAAVVGRLMSTRITIDVARRSVDNVSPADGRIRLDMGVRTMPLSTGAGITITQLAALSPTVTINNLDPGLTVAQLSLIGV